MIDSFGLRLSQLISTRGLTQGEFAKGLGSSPAFVSDMIRGVKKPGAEFLSRLADEYQVSIDWLLTGRGTLEGATTIDGEWFRVVMLRVELARLAADGDAEAIRLADELAGRKQVKPSVTTERQALLAYLTKISEQSALISGLYNGFITHPDTTMRAREVLAAALVHFQSNHADPLAAMLAGVDAAPVIKKEDDKKATPAKQKIKGTGHRIASGNYYEGKQ